MEIPKTAFINRVHRALMGIPRHANIHDFPLRKRRALFSQALRVLEAFFGLLRKIHTHFKPLRKRRTLLTALRVLEASFFEICCCEKIDRQCI